jgi:hypothetical protein
MPGHRRKICQKLFVDVRRSALNDEALQVSRKDRDEGNLDKRDEMFPRPLDDGVQPPVAAQPGEGSFNHPADAGRNEPSIATAGNRLDGDPERLSGFDQPLAPIAELTQRWSLETTIGERAQNRHDTLRIVPVRRRDIDRQRDAVFVNGDLDLDASDLLPAIDAAVKATRRRATGSTIDDDGARFRSIPARAPPGTAQPIEQPAPEAKPGPTSEQSIKRAEGDGAELSDCPPLDATETNAPDRHDGLETSWQAGLRFPCSRLDAIDDGNWVGWSPFRAPRTIRLLVVIEAAPTGSCSLQTNSKSRDSDGASKTGGTARSWGSGS